jgi:cytochrome c oxidase cbb3-type subunit I/II
MLDPQSMSPGSIMPPYEWLLTNNLDTSKTSRMIWAMRKLGVPYPDNYEQQANLDLESQADSIKKTLGNENIKTSQNKEIIALIAYLQRLGKDIKAAPPEEATAGKEQTSVFGN